MSSAHLVDPELKPALESLPPFELSRESIGALREAFKQQLAAAPPPPELPVTVEVAAIPGPAGAPTVRAVLYRPTGVAGSLPVVLHIHGGGYVFGTPELNDVQNRLLATQLGCLVCSVDYRMAPDTSHPGPVEDCYAALKWLHDSAAKLGIDARRIGVKGESAGGGLAAAVALLARDRGRLPIAFQHLIYPMIDDRTCVDPDPNTYVGEFIWTAENNVFGWTALLGEAPGGPSVSPYAAASRATDLSGLPPAFLSVGALDLFLEENLAYATRLMRAGVPVELHVYPGAFHGFGMAVNARTSIAAERDSLEALRRAIHG